MTIRSITLTGLNESVDLQKVVELTRAAEGINVEWGVLYSPDRAGNEPRYPSLDWIENVKWFAFATSCASRFTCAAGASNNCCLKTKR